MVFGHTSATQEAQTPTLPNQRFGHPERRNQLLVIDVLEWYHPTMRMVQQENRERVGHPPRFAMTHSKKRHISFIAVAFFALAALPVCGAPGGIRPFRTTAFFSKGFSRTRWKAYVLASGGKRAYELSFEPEYGPKNEIIGLDLVLADAQKRQGLSGSNLLNPHNWHGLQPYDFLGKDLAQGADKSSFGSHRELKLNGRKLLVRMDISSARVSPLPDGDYEIDQLELAVAVDNLSS